MASKKFDYIFIDELSDKLKCSICLDVAEDPKQHEKCGKIFCSQCIKKNRTNPCPSCRGGSPNYFTDMRAAQEIRDLQVKCCNFNEGCQWQGSVGTLEKHLTACNCEFVPCKYSYIGCDVKMSRKDIKQHEENNDKHHLHLALQSTAIPTLSHGEYLVFKITKYRKMIQNKEVFLSDPFYTHSNGYKMQFKIYVNEGSNEGSCLSVSLCLLNGPFDEMLQWPFSGKVTFSILVPNSEHSCRSAHFYYKDEPYGQPGISWDKEVPYCSYTSLSTIHAKDDTLYFRVRVTFSNSTPWLECGKQIYPKLPFVSKTYVIKEPLVFKMENYATLKSNKAGFASPQFFTSPYGYQMYLSIFPDGEGDGKGECVSVFICIAEGPYDVSLLWPFLGTVEIGLLNQFSNDQHYTECLSIGREVNMQIGESFGYPKFIKHSELQHGNKQYLMNDTLYFRVSVTLNNHKPWLACTPLI